MKVYYKLDKNHRVGSILPSKSYDHTGYVVTKKYPELSDLSAYTVMDGKFVYLGLSDETKAQRKAYADNEYTNALRALRQSACFDICDRAAWYDGLTDSQKAEVREWRKAWLNITETHVIPTAPSFVEVKAVELPARREVAEPVDNSGSIVYLKPTGEYKIDTDRRDSDMAAFLESRIDELAKTETDKRLAAIDIEVAALQAQIADKQAELENQAKQAADYQSKMLAENEEFTGDEITAKFESDIMWLSSEIETLTAKVYELTESKQSEYFPPVEQAKKAMMDEWENYYESVKESYYVKDQYGDFVEIYTEE